MIETVHLMVLAALVFAFGLVSKRFASTVVTGPMAFVGFGLLLTPGVCDALGIGHLFAASEAFKNAIHLLGELTLVVVLFTDAVQIELRSLVRSAGLPMRLLAIGMPLTIVLGAALAAPLFPGLGMWELALLATMLAPTDAALGQAVVTSQRVPKRIRQALSVESGLNDGIAVPLVVIFAALASVGHSHGDDHAGAAMTGAQCATFAAKQVVLGPLAGAIVGAVGAWLMAQSIRRDWMEHAYQELAGIALAIIAFVVASQIGGNGFIAAFVAGIVVGNSSKEVCACLYDFAEAESQLLMLATFFLVGLTLAAEPLREASWHAWAYGALSLSLIRMAPVALSLIGLGVRTRTTLFVGWFGPRGLASVLFSVLLIHELPVPNGELIGQVVIITVLLSVVAHGITAAPPSALYGKSMNRDPGPTYELERDVAGESPVMRSSHLIDHAHGGNQEARP